MKRHGTWPWFKRTFEKGASQSQDQRFWAGADGHYYDLVNGIPDKENLGRIKKIGGETLEHPSIDNSCINSSGETYYGGLFALGKWECVAAISTTVDGTHHLVEFWKDSRGTDDGLDSFIRVDGIIYCASPILDFSGTVDVDEDGTGNVFITNGVSAPMYFNVTDLIEKSCTGYYYGDLTEDAVSLNLSSPNNFPKFIEITNDASYPADQTFTGTTGLSVGSYSYSLRYGTTAGEYSPRSHNTPLIPLPLYFGRESEKFPSVSMVGAEPGTITTNGIVLRFRTYNNGNYDFVELLRHEYQGGLSIGYTPQTSVVVGSISIQPGEIATYTVVDFGGVDGTSTIEEDTGSMTVVNTANSLKYFNSRLWLMGVDLASRKLPDTSGLVFGIGGESLVPILKNLGSDGYGSMYNNVYNRQYMSGEKYGFAAVFFDAGYTKSFAVPIDMSVQMPDRRDAMGYTSRAFSDVRPIAAKNDGTVGPVFERFDNTDDIASSGSFTATNSILRPVNFSDDADDLNPSLTNEIGIHSGVWQDYNPQTWASRMFAQGLLLGGVDTSKLPDWVESFAIVRTTPAGRTLAQGLGVFDFSETRIRRKNQTIFYSPDLVAARGLISTSQIEFIKNNCKAQLVSPLGFTSHPLYVEKDGDAYYSDMLVRANILRDIGLMNPIDNSMGLSSSTYGNGYVGFGKYRNGIILAGADNDFSFYDGGIVGAVPATEEYRQINDFWDPETDFESAMAGRSDYFRIKFDKNIYDNVQYFGGPNGFQPYYTEQAREFCHPLYTTNIINPNAAIPTGDNISFYDTGVFVKLRSCIRLVTDDDSNSSIAGPSIDLVDERHEDCCSYTFGETSGQKSHGYIFEKRQSDGIEYRWVDVSLITSTEITSIRQALNANGVATFQGKNIYGLYSSSVSGDQYSISFDVATTFGGASYYKPKSGSELWVKYDSSKPIRVFGGDSYVGEVAFSAIDHDGSTYTPFAYPMQSGGFRGLNTKDFFNNQNASYTDILLRDTGAAGIPGSAHTKMRQLVYSTILESRVNMAMDYEVEDSSPYLDKFYPVTNYIPRNSPTSADPAGDWSSAPSAYKAAYPDEDDLWGYGGFRTAPKGNVDYLHTLNVNTYIKEPSVGFVETTSRGNRALYSNLSNGPSSLGFRQYPSGNYYDINYGGGDIIRAVSVAGQNGDNLYAITDHGVVILLVDKQIISSLGGNPDNLILSADGDVVKGEYWVSRNIGLPGTISRAIATSNDTIMFTDKNDIYVVRGTEITTANGLYYRKVKRWLDAATSIEAAYDWDNGHFWLQTTGGYNGTLAFDLKNGWVGEFWYWYDKIVTRPGSKYGVGSKRNTMEARSFEIGVGDKINDVQVKLELTIPLVPATEYPASVIIPYESVKDFKRLRVSAHKDGITAAPAFTLFYKDFASLDSGDYFSYIDADTYKNYGNFEAWIKDAKKYSGQMIIAKIVDSGNIDTIDFVSLQFNKK